MFLLRLIVFAVFIGLTTVGVPAQKIAKESIVSEGKKRTYYLYVPASVKPNVPVPLLVLFHGSNRNGLSLVEKWKEVANHEGIILLGPDSADPSRWSFPNDGPTFVNELVESIRAKHSINPRRIYLFGHSGGAIFALMLSMYESEYFAATAVHAGALYAESGSLLIGARRKIPIYLQVGTQDRLFPLSVVKATRDALNSQGFPVQLMEIPGHDHWYYDLAPKINQAAWEFLRAYELPSDPRYQEYKFNVDGGSSREATEFYTKGIERQSANDHAGAIAAYTRAIELNGKWADAYNNRGIAYTNQQNYEAAVADFTRSIEITPSDAAYNNRGNVYFSQKKFNESISDYSEALKLKPLAVTHTNRGIVYAQTNQDSQALADYERAIQLDPKFGRAYVLRGLIALKTGQKDSAQKDFDKAFQLDPSLHAEFDPIIRQTRPPQSPE